MWRHHHLGDCRGCSDSSGRRWLLVPPVLLRLASHCRLDLPLALGGRRCGC